MERDLSALHDECPKCGKPFLYVKDWRRAGTLFVHGYDTDKASGLRFPMACQVPEPVALGLVSMDAWAGRTSHLESAPFSQGHFGLDSLPGPYRGWTDGERWNGWAAPRFEFEEALRIARDFMGLRGGDGDVFTARYDEASDAFVFRDPASEEDEVYGPETLEAGGAAVKVYPIGTKYWTWEKA